jgi:hypothetical protein
MEIPDLFDPDFSSIPDLFDPDFSPIPDLPTTYEQHTIKEPHVRSSLTLSTITTASFGLVPLSTADEAIPATDVRERVTQRLPSPLIALSQVSTIAAFAPSQSLETTGLLQSKKNTIIQGTLVEETTEETGSRCTWYARDEEVKSGKHQESTTLERRICTEQELEAPLGISSEESQSAISPEKDQAAPQPVTSPAPTDPYTAATYVSHPEVMDIGDNRKTSLNADAGKDQHHQSVIERDTTLVFDVAGEDRPNDGNKAASSPTTKKSFPTKRSWSRPSQPIIFGTNYMEPIIIDSGDEGDTQPNVGGDEQHALPSRKRFKRTRAEGPAGLVRWADPNFEKAY